jgi:hypothetical protein
VHVNALAPQVTQLGELKKKVDGQGSSQVPTPELQLTQFVAVHIVQVVDINPYPELHVLSTVALVQVAAFALQAVHLPFSLK